MLSPRAFTLNKDASEELAPKDVDADANGSGGGNAQKEIMGKYSFLKLGKNQRVESKHTKKCCIQRAACFYSDDDYCL